jgi:DNA-binding CsgD family transcriptional regulator
VLIEMKSTVSERRGPSTERLTPRERQVIALAHLRNQDIAGELGISPATVKTHMERVLMKLGAETRTQAYALVMERKAA